MSITAVSSFAAVDMLTSLHETRLTFAIDAPPEGDLLLRADAWGATFGIHATEAYRFGRPEPTPEQPKPTGPEVTLGSRKFGHAVLSQEPRPGGTSHQLD